MTDADIRNMMAAAVMSPFGILITTSDPELLKRRAYVVRSAARKQGNLSFDVLSFRTSPVNPTGELWIIKNAREAQNVLDAVL
jgi:hypothetical protein